MFTSNLPKKRENNNRIKYIIELTKNRLYGLFAIFNASSLFCLQGFELYSILKLLFDRTLCHFYSTGFVFLFTSLFLCKCWLVFFCVVALSSLFLYVIFRSLRKISIQLELRIEKKISEKFIADRIKVRAIKMFHRNGTYCIIEFRFFRLLIENEQKKWKTWLEKQQFVLDETSKWVHVLFFFSVLCQRREKKRLPKKAPNVQKRARENENY